MATLGRTTQGASAVPIKNRLCGRLETFAAGDEITSVSVYLNCDTAAKNVNAALYNAANGSRLALGTETADATGNGWVEIPISYTVSSVTDIVIAVQSAGGSGTHDIVWDTNAAVTSYHDSAAGLPYPPNATWSGNGWGTDLNYDLSLYATYTPASSGSSLPIDIGTGLLYTC